MITEENKAEKAKSQLEEEIDYLKQIIEASSRYERLLSNSDFNGILADLKKVAQFHKEEIDNYLKMFSLSTSFFKRMRLTEVMSQHQTKMDIIIEAIMYPEKIVSKAIEARERIAKIKEQEKEKANG